MAERPRPSRRGETPRQYPPELTERALWVVAETTAEQGGQRAPDQAGPESGLVR
jgi:hypothetical protein